MTQIDGVIDSIASPQTTNSPIPSQVMHAPALLAYQHGNSWPTYEPYMKARPDLAKKGWIISVTLTYTGASRMYDIEPGGGEIGNIRRFMANADKRWGKPILYTFASSVAALISGAASQGIGRHEYYVLAAHVGRGKHICGPHTCGYPQSDGTQYLFSSSPDYDKSVLNSYMLPAANHKPSSSNQSGGNNVGDTTTQPFHGGGMAAVVGSGGLGNQCIYVHGNDGTVWMRERRDGKWGNWENLGKPS